MARALLHLCNRFTKRRAGERYSWCRRGEPCEGGGASEHTPRRSGLARVASERWVSEFSRSASLEDVSSLRSRRLRPCGDRPSWRGPRAQKAPAPLRLPVRNSAGSTDTVSTRTACRPPGVQLPSRIGSGKLFTTLSVQPLLCFAPSRTVPSWFRCLGLGYRNRGSR